MSNEDYVVVIGAANIDIQGFSINKLVMEDSNPGRVKISSGGVGRNIGENLSRLGANVKLMTVLGDDPYSQALIDECRKSSIDVSSSLIIKNMTSPIYLSILDNNGDMELALCDNEILENMSTDYLKENHEIIEGAEIILIDTNLPTHIIEFIANTYKHKTIFVDTVSTQKALKIKSVLGSFDTIKLNFIEAQALSNIYINDCTEAELHKISDYFLESGIQNIFITLGKDGVYYKNKSHSNLYSAPFTKVVNATGAGDAFMAGLIYSRLNNLDIDFTSKFSTGAAILALSHENTINPNMSVKNIYNLLEELKLC